jgi:hypothetical protein
MVGIGGSSRMKGQAYAHLFRYWQHLFQKSLQAPPQFLL